MTQQLPDGYTTRPATAEDAVLVSTLWNERSHAVRGTTPYTEEGAANRWNRPDLNLKTDSRLIFGPSNRLVGYALVLDVKDPPVDVFCGYSVHPDFDETDWLWAALFGWIEAEARRVISKAPAEARIALVAGVDGDDATETARLEAHGFEHSRTFRRMKTGFSRPIERAETPAGISIRTFESGKDDEHLVHAYRDAFRDHYGHLEEPFEKDLAKWRMWMKDDDFDADFWFLAVSDYEIVGYCCCYPEGGQGAIALVDELGIRRNWRRRGIARALLTRALVALRESGASGARLSVDSQSRHDAMSLYTSVGMEVVSEHHTYVKELRPGINLVTQ